MPAVYLLLRVGAGDAIVWSLPTVIILGCVSCGLVTSAVGFDGVLRRFFSMATLRRAGNISYSFYLAHGLTLKALSRLAHAYAVPTIAQPMVFWSMIPVTFVASLTSAVALFCLVERPLSLVPREDRSATAPVRPAAAFALGWVNKRPIRTHFAPRPADRPSQGTRFGL
jgi:peptidoglycan/LPS O-acetylase OafA/YrhL